jgi:hypothetical protein
MENSRKPEPIQKNGSPNRTRSQLLWVLTVEGVVLLQIAADGIND